jgi:hypothetical protein
MTDAVGSGDIHLENLDSGVLSGTWRPDGRLDPLASLRPAMLSVFDGLSGNGDWYLNVADLVGGTVETPAGRMQLSGWTLTLSGYEAAGGAVPESSTSWVVVGLLALGASRVIGGRRNLNPPRGD